MRQTGRASGRCLTGGNFPGGLCTRAYSSGVCMRNCATNVDCASLGTQYECNAESLEGSSGGQQRVCRGR